MTIFQHYIKLNEINVGCILIITITPLRTVYALNARVRQAMNNLKSIWNKIIQISKMSNQTIINSTYLIFNWTFAIICRLSPLTSFFLPILIHTHACVIQWIIQEKALLAMRRTACHRNCSIASFAQIGLEPSCPSSCCYGNWLYLHDFYCCRKKCSAFTVPAGGQY